MCNDTLKKHWRVGAYSSYRANVVADYESKEFFVKCVDAYNEKESVLKRGFDHLVEIGKIERDATGVYRLIK